MIEPQAFQTLSVLVAVVAVAEVKVKGFEKRGMPNFEHAGKDLGRSSYLHSSEKRLS